MIACTLPALTDFIPERKRKELAGEVARELQVVGNAASIAINKDMGTEQRQIQGARHGRKSEKRI